MPGSGKHNVNNIDSFFKVRPSKTNLREGEQVSFLENGDLIKQEKRNGIVYETKYTELNKVKVDSSQQASTTSVVSSNITGVLAGTGLTGGGSIGTVTLNIDSTVATLTGTQTLTNKTLASPTFTGTANGANLTLTGDLTVGGTTTTLNAQNLQVKDKNIVLNYLDGDASSTADGAGITIQDAVNSTTDATILWDNSSPTNSPGEFDFSHSINVTGNISLSGTVDGRDIATDGSKLDGIEALADVTDTTNVTAAGALMDSEVSNLSFVKGLTSGISNGNVLVANAAVSDNDFLKIDGTSVEGRTVAEMRSDLNVEDGADVTDTTNVTAAGALMDSEVTDLDGIKSLTVPNSTTISAFAKTYLDDADTTTFQNTIFGTTDVALGGQAKPRVVTLDYKTDSLTAIGSGDNFIIIDASDNYNLKVANFPTIIGTTGTINANEFARFTNSTTLQALTAAETVTALGLDDVPTVSSGSNDRIATFTGTSALQGESNLTFNSSNVLYVNGSVGIGATSPSASLEISKAGGEYLDLDISGISSGTSKLRFLDGGTAKFELRHFAGSALLNANLSVYDHNTSSEALTVQVGGNVGIGTNSPANELHVAGSIKADTSLLIGSNSNFLTSQLKVGDGTRDIRLNANHSSKAVVGTVGSHDFNFITANTIRATVDSGGNFGIGTESPSRTLQVNGDGIIRLVNDSGDAGIDFNSSDMQLRYRSASDKLQVYSYGTSTNVMTIQKSNGFVGIGTESPGHSLHVYHTANYEALKIETNAGGALMRATDSTGVTETGTQGGSWVARTASTARLTINQSGTVYIPNNVGIGTASPAYKLQVSGGDIAIDVGERLYFGGGNHTYISEDIDDRLRFFTGGAEFMRFTEDSTDTINLYQHTRLSVDGKSLSVGANNDLRMIHDTHSYLQNTTASMMVIQNTGQDQDIAFMANDNGSNNHVMRITSGGNVGIGTTSPNHNLQIEGGGSESILNLTTTGNSNGLDIIVGTDGHAAIWLRENDYMHFATNNTERMRIDSSGNVGIGTTSPSVKLQVADTSTHCFIRVKGGTGSYAGIDFGDDDDDDISRIRHNNSDNSLGFYTSNAEKMRIDSSGNIGIGTTSPAEKLQVNGNLKIGDAGNITTFTMSGNYPVVYFDDVETGAYIANNANGLFIGKTNTPSAANDLIKIDLTNGNVGIGTTSPQSKFQVKQTSTNSAITSVNPAIVINNQGGSYTDGHYYSSIMFAKANSNGATKGAAIAPVIQDSGNSTELSFSTIVNGSALTEALRIDKTQDAHFDQDVIAFSTTPSDIRLKENFTKIENGLDVVSKLEGHTFNWKKGGDRLSAGFKAQEVEKILPHLVDEKKLPLKSDDDKEYKILRYEEMIPYLVEAIKEQQQQINKLEEKLNG